jgi:hypothetical protein
MPEHYLGMFEHRDVEVVGMVHAVVCACGFKTAWDGDIITAIELYADHRMQVVFERCKPLFEDGDHEGAFQDAEGRYDGG